MRTNKLAFNQLSQEMEVMELENLNSIKGGVGSGDDDVYEFGRDAAGNNYYREIGSKVWIPSLEQITVSFIAPENPSPSFNWSNYQLIDAPNPFGTGGGGGGNGNNGGGANYYKVEGGQAYFSYDGVKWEASLNMIEVFSTPSDNPYPTNWGGAPIHADPDGTSYYLDNAGRVHYVMDTSTIWDGVKDMGTDVSTYFGALWDYIKRQGASGASAAGPLISIESHAVKQWWNQYGNKTGYMGAGGVWVPFKP